MAEKKDSNIVPEAELILPRGKKVILQAEDTDYKRGLIVELLDNAEHYLDEFESVIIWSKQSTLDLIVDKSWIKKINYPSFERNLVVRVIWQRFVLKNELKKNIEEKLVEGI